MPEAMRTHADAGYPAASPTSARAKGKKRTGRGKRNPRHPRNIDAYIVLTIGGLLMMFPFAWQIIMALSTQAQVTSIPPTFWPGELQWENFTAVFEAVPFGSQFLVSVGVTVLRVGGQLILCAMAGYAFARLHFRGRSIVFGVLLSILMVPNQIYLIPQYEIVQGLGWLNTVWGIAAPGVFSALGTFLMRQAFIGLPDELEEAARLDGANVWQVFRRILLPLVGPTLSSVAILTVLASWNDLMWPLVVSTYDDSMPLAVGIATMQGQFSTDYPVLMAASLMAMAPIIILFLVLQRQVVNGLATQGMKG